FIFDASDESIKKLREEAFKVQEEFHSIGADVDDDTALEKAKKVLKRGFNLMLGEDAFEKIYDLSPSVMACMQYFVQLVEGLEQELQNMGLSETQEDLAKKYLQKKK